METKVGEEVEATKAISVTRADMTFHKASAKLTNLAITPRWTASEIMNLMSNKCWLIKSKLILS